MPDRIYNFSAGPATMPLPVLEKAAGELTCYGQSGMSVMEMSHRSKDFIGIIENAEADLRKLMAIPDNYKVLFLQGGATLQFSMVPLNLYRNGGSADYVNTGSWTKKAIKEAKKVGAVNVVASSEGSNFDRLPDLDPAAFDSKAEYFYIVTNNTIYGTRYPQLPKTGNVPLVADASSNILSEVYDINDFGLLYFGAQKNVGPAGLTVVIVRDDLIGHAGDNVPSYLDYAVHAKANSLYNTPPCYAIYMAGLVFQWLLDEGGVKAMQEVNQRKASMLYDFIDNSDMYRGTVAVKEHRSLMNVTYVLPDEELTAKFIKEATQAGLSNLKGHRSVGGIRASIYNAMPEAGVRALVDFMKKFELQNK